MSDLRFIPGRSASRCRTLRTIAAACLAALLSGNLAVAEMKHSSGKTAVSKPSPAPNGAIQKKPTAARKVAIDALVEQIPEPDARITLVPGQSKRLKLARRVQRMSIADVTAADVVPVASREIQILGRKSGTTTVQLWLEGDREREPSVVTLLVQVELK